MRIICDKDEVLCDMMPTLLDIYNRENGTNVTMEDITQWQLPDDMIKIFMEREGFFQSLPPIDGAIEGIRSLVALGHDVIIATSPSHNGRIAMEKYHWIGQWLPEFANNFVTTNRKDFFNADIIIDDNSKHLDLFNGLRILMSRPWNKGRSAPKRPYVSVDDWDGILYEVIHHQEYKDNIIKYHRDHPRDRLEAGR